MVSIHTPIQGVTAFCLMDVLTDVFQSTHPYRVWHQFGLVGSLLYCFNPHTHTGCDLRRSLERRTRTGFNPHTHTGCDDVQICVITLIAVSIHTPIQGVTDVNVKVCVVAFVSIHTPIQGVTDWGSGKTTHPRVSIHTPIQGVTVLSQPLPLFPQVSIHTPIQGVTHWGWWNDRRHQVSIHTPIQGVTESFCNNLLTPGFQSTHPYRVWPHIQQKAEYHDAKIDILRKTTK